MERRFLGVCVLVLLVLIASGDTTEGRTCESQSHSFHGTCLSNHNCAEVCHGEGFYAGVCRGFRRRCFCTRQC